MTVRPLGAWGVVALVVFTLTVSFSDGMGENSRPLASVCGSTMRDRWNGHD